MKAQYILLFGAALGVADVFFNKKTQGFGDNSNHMLAYASATTTALGIYLTLKGKV